MSNYVLNGANCGTSDSLFVDDDGDGNDFVYSRSNTEFIHQSLTPVRDVWAPRKRTFTSLRATMTPDRGRFLERDWRVEKILDKRNESHLVEYKVRWAHTPIQLRRIKRDMQNRQYVQIAEDKWYIARVIIPPASSRSSDRSVEVVWEDTWRHVWHLPKAGEAICTYETVRDYDSSPAVTAQSPRFWRRLDRGPEIFPPEGDLAPVAHMHIEDENFYPMTNTDYTLSIWWYYKEVLIGTTPDTWRVFLNHPIRQQILFNPRFTGSNAKAYNMRRNANVRALLIYPIGNARRNPCGRCRSGGGAFLKCVTENSQFIGACVNCSVAGVGHECEYHFIRRRYEKPRTAAQYEQRLASPITRDSRQDGDAPLEIDPDLGDPGSTSPLSSLNSSQLDDLITNDKPTSEVYFDAREIRNSSLLNTTGQAELGINRVRKGALLESDAGSASVGSASLLSSATSLPSERSPTYDDASSEYHNDFVHRQPPSPCNSAELEYFESSQTRYEDFSSPSRTLSQLSFARRSRQDSPAAQLSSISPRSMLLIPHPTSSSRQSDGTRARLRKRALTLSSQYRSPKRRADHSPRSVVEDRESSVVDLSTPSRTPIRTHGRHRVCLPLTKKSSRVFGVVQNRQPAASSPVSVQVSRIVTCNDSHSMHTTLDHPKCRGGLHPCVDDRCGFRPPDTQSMPKLIYNDQRFGKSESTYEQVRYIMGRSCCATTEAFYQQWLNFFYKHHNEPWITRYDRETFIAERMYKALNDVVAVACPTRPSTFGLLSEEPIVVDP